MNHKCHARGCKNSCHPERLMCKEHWDLVPINTQNRVLETYVDGQCKLNPLPSKEWHDAADVAIFKVAYVEALKVIKHYKAEMRLLNIDPDKLPKPDLIGRS